MKRAYRHSYDQRLDHRALHLVWHDCQEVVHDRAARAAARLSVADEALMNALRDQPDRRSQRVAE